MDPARHLGSAEEHVAAALRRHQDAHAAGGAAVTAAGDAR